MSDLELTIRGDVERLRLRPDDHVIVSLDARLSMDQHNHLKEIVQKEFPDNRVVVCSGGVRISTVRADHSNFDPDANRDYGDESDAA